MLHSKAKLGWNAPQSKLCAQFSPPSTMDVGVVQLVPITTNVVSSNPAHGGVYSIQHYVITFDSDTP